MAENERAMSPADTLFGRDSALDELARVLARARDGRGALVIVRGPAGIGKTSLVEAAFAGHTVLWGRAASAEVAPELHVWGQVLRAAVRRGLATGDDLDPAAVLAPAATSELAGTGQERFLRADAIIGALRAIGDDDPVVVVLDDVQWADPESLLVVDLLAAELLDLPVVLALTARDDSQLALPRSDLSIELRGLDPDGVRGLLGAQTGQVPSDEVVQAALEHTGGNPFFVAEVARLLGPRVLDAPAWRGTLPPGVRAVLHQRLEALPEGTRQALLAAAVVGATVDPALVADVLGVTAAEVDEGLDAAVDERLVVTLDDGQVAFAHALVRDTVLADARSSELRRLHDTTAGVFEARGGAAATVAAHHLAAGNGADAVRWAAEAGQAALADARYDEAAQWLDRALAGADRVGLDALTLRLQRADALSRSGHGDEARDAYLAVAAAARGVDDEVFGRAALGVGALGGGFEIRLLDHAQVALLGEALDRLGAEPPALVARLRARLSVALTLQEEHVRRVALAEGAVDLARTSGDPGALVHALAAWCDAHAAPTHSADRLEVAAEMVGAALRSGDPELELLARRFRLVALMELGRAAEATVDIAAFARLADALRQPAFRWYARLEEGMLAFLHGDLDTAEALALDAAAEGRRAGSANAQMLTEGGLLASIRRERGDLDGFLRILTEANRAHAEASRGMEFLYPIFLVGYGADEAAVAGALAQLPDDVSFADDDALFLQVWASLGDAAAFVHDDRWGRRAIEKLTPFGAHLVLDGTASVCLGPVAGVLGRLEAARGDDAEARRWFDKAARVVAPLDAPLLMARVQRDAEALGSPPSAAPARPTPAGPSASPSARFTREGETWWVAFDGHEARLRDSKGLHDLAVLLARPNHEVHCLDLVAAAEGGTSRGRPADADLGPTLDATAREAYEARVRELTEMIEDAEAANDIDRAARLDDERAALLRELAAALGLSGRARPQGSDAERARKAVAMRIRDAVGRIEREVPPLARHLRHAVRTGTFCAYEPEHPVEWRL